MTFTKKLPLALASAFALTTFAFTTAPSASADQVTSSEQAKSIAFADAGVQANQVHSVKVNRDSDNDRPVFEVEFRKGNSEYDYTIDAETGAITEKDIDLDEKENANNNQSPNQSQKGQPARLSIQDAKGIALRDAGLTESQTSKLKVDPDSDNDVPTYKIEFKRGRVEYRYTINAVDGSILQKESN